MSAHTPTPWTFERPNKDSEDAGWQGAIKGPGGVEVCSFGDSTQYYPTEGCPPDEDDGEFILRAVNAHDELLAMLLELEWSATVDDSKGGTNPGCPSCDATKPGSGDAEYEGHAEECALDTLIEKAGGR